MITINLGPSLHCTLIKIQAREKLIDFLQLGHWHTGGCDEWKEVEDSTIRITLLSSLEPKEFHVRLAVKLCNNWGLFFQNSRCVCASALMNGSRHCRYCVTIGYYLRVSVEAAATVVVGVLCLDPVFYYDSSERWNGTRTVRTSSNSTFFFKTHQMTGAQLSCNESM